MAQNVYDPKVVEEKWQRSWEENGVNQVDVYAAENPYYVLMMFPYPSAEGLHVGNVYAFTGADIQGRFRRLLGYDVFEPVGFDAFGIHSENFAMKINRHPADLIPQNIDQFRKQLRMMGLMVDWRHEVDTTSPEYYKWTQWIFVKLFEAGFVYRDEKELNFCPKCGTVIADEQVNPDGTCERHDDTYVQKRTLPCWFFKITEFADRLLTNHEWLDWSEVTKIAQINWIGKSKGAEVDFQVAGSDEKIRVFTTRPDTLWGATYMVLAPEHPLVDKIAASHKKDAIAAYRKEAAEKSKEERTAEEKEKSGVDIGAKAVNPVNSEEIPVFISDYVLMGYGTGAIMAVPAHDERDFAFAENYQLPIRPVISPDPKELQEFNAVKNYRTDAKSPAEIREAVLTGRMVWTGPGTAVNSANDEVSINDLHVDEAKARITEWLEKKGLGEFRTTYRLRDWGISRQRYWGPPVPIIYDEDGEPHPVPKDQLPVELPALEDFRPKGDGRGPLAGVPEWYDIEIDGKKYTRDTDVMDNFLDSAWYFLRYPSARDTEQAWDPELIKKWLPVDLYVGGNEHAVLHLMYTRFLCMALHEAGVLRMKDLPEMKDQAEPFRKFRAHGLLIKEGSKMSKTKGNVVNPDIYVEEWGADTLRMYLMFLGPYLQGGDFRDADIIGVRRFLNRVHEWYFDPGQKIVPDEEVDRTIRIKTHQTIKKLRSDYENLSYNTAVAALMELHNALKSAESTSEFIRESFAVMLAPLAPFIAEEIWREALGKNQSIWREGRFSEFDPALTVQDQIEIVVQVNGKLRDRLQVPREAGREEIEALVKESRNVQRHIEGKQIRRTIYVPGRLVNLIVG